ncbi:hypothetical protein SAMN05892883_1867 [Jatrophihabitans sp. GAS493]|uniref:hypothetical protein n=1 Tax=Jatrophihabitans sp. GAS493 TaxID=1907575 RepID=UPI000BC0E015|nr:hypothetical protein [Jatrophihabitans sp. GAS493]SOD72476.1 hypothetical protein SAMN05892883_1867 [Jatrophihabitans sp. GAS493]
MSDASSYWSDRGPCPMRRERAEHRAAATEVRIDRPGSVVGSRFVIAAGLLLALAAALNLIVFLSMV